MSSFRFLRAMSSEVHGLEDYKVGSDRSDFSKLCLVSTHEHSVTSLDNLFQSLTTCRIKLILLVLKHNFL